MKIQVFKMAISLKNINFQAKSVPTSFVLWHMLLTLEIRQAPTA